MKKTRIFSAALASVILSVSASFSALAEPEATQTPEIKMPGAEGIYL